jgi:hypothetical protein
VAKQCKMGGYAERRVAKQRDGWLSREMGGQAENLGG